jgi:hypothetical protein
LYQKQPIFWVFGKTGEERFSNSAQFLNLAYPAWVSPATTIADAPGSDHAHLEPL